MPLSSPLAPSPGRKSGRRPVPKDSVRPKDSVLDGPVRRDPLTGVEVSLHGRDRGAPGLEQHHETVLAARLGPDGLRVVGKRVLIQTCLDRYLHRGELVPRDGRPRGEDWAERRWQAGQRLQADFHRAGAERRVVAQYDDAPRARATGAGHCEEIAADARRRMQAALQAVGLRLSPILVHVCCLDRPAGEWARMKGLHEKAALPILALALDGLVDHYGTAPR